MVKTRKVSARSSVLSRMTIPWISLSLLGLLASSAQAAEVRSMTVVGQQSLEDRAHPHAIEFGVQSQNDVGTTFIHQGDSSDARLSRAVESHLAYGYDFGERFSLKLGVKHSQESVRLLNDSETVENHAYTQPMIDGRFSLLQRDMFGADASAFAQGGAGKKADESLTASSKASGGWLTSARIGSLRSFYLTGSVGMRYRNPEQFESVTLRHERLYSTALHGMVTKDFELFGGIDSRSIMMKPTNESVKYQAHTSSSITAGVKAAYNQFLFTLFGSKATNYGAGFGQGQSQVGLAMEYRFAGGRLPSFAASSKTESSSSDSSSDDELSFTCSQNGPLCEKAAVDMVQDVKTGVIDRDGDVGEKDEFQLLEERQKQERARLTKEDLAFEQDIENVKIEKQREEEAEARRHKLAQENERKMGKARMKRDMKIYKKVHKEVKEEVSNLPEITDEDVSWRGLE